MRAVPLSLTVVSPQMLSIAYKSVVNARRSTARMISGLEARESNEGKAAKIKEYRTKVTFMRIKKNHCVPPPPPAERQMILPRIKTDPGGRRSRVSSSTCAMSS